MIIGRDLWNKEPVPAETYRPRIGKWADYHCRIPYEVAS